MQLNLVPLDYVVVDMIKKLKERNINVLVTFVDVNPKIVEIIDETGFKIVLEAGMTEHSYRDMRATIYDEKKLRYGWRMISGGSKRNDTPYISATPFKTIITPNFRVQKSSHVILLDKPNVWICRDIVGFMLINGFDEPYDFSMENTLRTHLETINYDDLNISEKSNQIILFDSEKFGYVIGLLYDAMKNGDEKRMGISCNEHLMAISLKIKNNVYIFEFLDPNGTTHIRRFSHKIIQNLELVDFISSLTMKKDCKRDTCCYIKIYDEPNRLIDKSYTPEERDIIVFIDDTNNSKKLKSGLIRAIVNYGSVSAIQNYIKEFEVNELLDIVKLIEKPHFLTRCTKVREFLINYFAEELSQGRLEPDQCSHLIYSSPSKFFEGIILQLALNLKIKMIGMTSAEDVTILKGVFTNVLAHLNLIVDGFYRVETLMLQCNDSFSEFFILEMSGDILIVQDTKFQHLHENVESKLQSIIP